MTRILDQLEPLGFRFRVDGEALKVSPSTFTPEQGSAIKANKAAIVEALHQRERWEYTGEVYDALLEMGCKLSVKEGKLIVKRHGGVIDEHDKDIIGRHKDSLIAILTIRELFPK